MSKHAKRAWSFSEQGVICEKHLSVCVWGGGGGGGGGRSV